MNALITYDASDALIAEIAQRCMPLKVAGIADKEGFERVHDARMEVKTTRVGIEKKRKELKADTLEYGRKVDAEAARLTKLLEPIEAHLEREEEAVLAERARLAAERAAAERARIQARLDELATFGAVGNPLEVSEMSDAEFAAAVATAKAAHEELQMAAAAEKAARIIAEKAERAAREKAEQERRAVEEAARAAKAAELEAERERLAQARAELEADRAAMAAERARAEAAQAAAEEARRVALAEAAAKEAALAAEALRPYRERVNAFLTRIAAMTSAEFPAAATEAETKWEEAIKGGLQTCLERLQGELA